jgi:hypothetical protein
VFLLMPLRPIMVAGMRRVMPARNDALPFFIGLQGLHRATLVLKGAGTAPDIAHQSGRGRKRFYELYADIAGDRCD